MLKKWIYFEVLWFVSMETSHPIICKWNQISMILYWIHDLFFMPLLGVFFVFFLFLYCASLSGCEFKCIQNQVVIPNHIWLVYHRNFLSRHTTLSLLPRVDDSEVHEIQLFMKWKSFYFILFIWTFNCQALCIFLKMPLLCITPNIYFKKATFLTVLCSV